MASHDEARLLFFDGPRRGKRRGDKLSETGQGPTIFLFNTSDRTGKSLSKAIRRETILRLYRKLIDVYVLRFDASYKRYRPSQRVAATLFVENYIVSNERLPEGIHTIKVTFEMS